MKINSIKIKNFLSIKDAKLDFESYSNLVRIVGKNKDTKPHSSNGAGKSSIIEAIVFALFGKTIRKTNDKSLINHHTKGKCEGEIVVNDNIVINRVKKPPMLTVTVDGENVTQDGIMTTQKYLDKILNTNFSVFLASMVFGQSNKTNFLTATAEEKRNIIQSFLDIGDVFQYRKNIKSKKGKAYQEKKIAETLCAESLKKKEKLAGKIKTVKDFKKQSKALLTSSKAKLFHKFSISELQENEQNRYSTKVELESASHGLSRAGMRIKTIRQKVKTFKFQPCEYCSEVPSTEKALVLDWEAELSKCIITFADYKNQIKELKEKLDTFGAVITHQDFDLFEKFKSFDTEHKILNGQLREHTTFIKKHQKEVEDAQRAYDLMRFWEQAFSEQGLIKFVIRNILTFFNDRVNYYLKFLSSSNFSITFDETLKEEIYNRGPLTYFDALSGGEKRKTSLSIMLGLNDLLLLSGKERSNLIFFDEVADSLDGGGVKGLYELIMEISKNKKVFVITHNDYLSSLLEDEAENLNVLKKANITNIQ